jgi:hypothetical protein
MKVLEALKIFEKAFISIKPFKIDKNDFFKLNIYLKKSHDLSRLVTT